MQPLVLIGYFPKKISPRPDWLAAPKVRWVRSVSECISPGPPDWIQHWSHNEMWVYSNIAAALAVIPQAEYWDYELHAYRMLPVQWHEGIEKPFIIPPMEIEPLPGDFQSVGFDAISIESGTSCFGHSPLSCNNMASEIPTNDNCLLEDLESAKRAAMEFSRGKGEPGPYYVVEVLRRVPMSVAT